ncbi:MAG: rhodanese-like domain-containing protein [Bacteroidetes bacterium]|nr:MAG: rhodanese-like domain-containing protein [Bacteroidota bacterium]
MVAIAVASVVWGGCQSNCSTENFTCIGPGEELEQLIAEQPEIIYLDVRTPGEIADGKIPNAIEIDVNGGEFEARIAALPKEATYVVYCRSGRRSVKACRIMAKAGFNKLYNLKGGYQAWSKQ